MARVGPQRYRKKNIFVTLTTTANIWAIRTYVQLFVVQM